VKYRDKPDLQERLAAEYVLGTLRGPARTRFQAWIREDAALARTVREWEARLNPMAATIAEVKPPRRVWRGIEERIAATRTSAPRTLASAVRAKPGLWESLAFWRNWGLVASGMAAALALAVALQKPEPPPTSTAMQPAYVAMIEDPSGKMKLVAYAARQSNELWVKMEGMPHEEGKSYELWGLPAQPGEKPRSLGVLPRTAKGTVQLAAVADKTLSDVPQLAISIEPEGGSKTGLPTGPVVAKGDCMKFW
jgi:anti-sigma-K factor RskA